MFKIKKVKPLFTGVVTTATRYVGDQYANHGGIILDTRKMAGSINPYQRVVAVGHMVPGVKEGDIVRINFKRYTYADHKPGKTEDTLGGGKVQHDNYTANIEVPFIEIDGVNYLYIQNNDIEYVVEEYEVGEGGLLE